MLRVGIAGLGRLGKRHASCLAKTEGCVLLAACSPVEEERAWAKQSLGVTHCHDDFQQLLGNAELDALVLVTPTNLHAEQVKQTLAAGKHVFVEKPLSLDTTTCEEVEKVAAQFPHLVAMVGFVRRFDASYQQAYADIAAGRIGKPFLVRSQTCDRNDPDGFFVGFAPQSGGIFLDCSVHDIDLARWMLGAPRALRAFATGLIALHPGLAACGDVDNGLAVVEFAGGARAVFYASRTFAHGHETTTEVIGTAGSLEIGAGAARNRIVSRNTHGISYQSTQDFFERFSDAFKTELDSFIAACEGRAIPPLQLSDATEATRIGQALALSLKSGQVEAIA